MEYRPTPTHAGAVPTSSNHRSRTPQSGTLQAGRSRSFLGYRFVAADPNNDALGPHVLEDFCHADWRASHRTAIALPAPVATKMAEDCAFARGVLAYCASRRQDLEKTTVVYDPHKELGIDRLFPKWLYAKRESGQVREPISCEAPPKDVLDLLCMAPKHFATSDIWRAWCDTLPATDPVEIRTDVVPPRIAALVLADPSYFTTPEYRSWIGRTKQRKREEIISREIAGLFESSLGATGLQA